MRKSIKALFTLSILLNIVLIGAGAGFYYRFKQPSMPVPHEMSEEAKLFVRRTYTEGREQMRPLFQEVRERRTQVEEVLTAEEFDRARYNSAVDQFLDTRARIARKKADIMGTALVDLPAEDRRKFAHKILDGLEGRRPKKHGRHHPGPDQVKDGLSKAAVEDAAAVEARPER